MAALRINGEIRGLIEEARIAADFRHPNNKCGLSDEAKEAVQIYLDTWVVSRLQMALDGIDGKLSAHEIRYIRY